MPKRIQRRRSKGWRMPNGAVYVGRPSKWGNPFNWRDIEDIYTDEEKRQHALDDYRNWLDHGFPQWEACRQFDAQRQWILDHIEDLHGADLACWCPLDQPCHADILLELANQ